MESQDGGHLKILHTADCHYSINNLDEIDKCVKHMIEKTIEENVDLAIIAGDFLDEYGLSIRIEDEVLVRTIASITMLANQCPVLMVYGTPSHERPRSLDVFAKLKTRHEVYVADQIEQVFLGDDNEFYPIGDMESPYFSKFKLLLSSLPPVTKADIVAYQNDKTSQEVNQEVKDLLLDVFRGFGQVNDQYDDGPCIFVGHGTIVGAKLSTGQTMVGKDLEYPIGDLRQAKCSSYCLGHIHRRQAWDEVMYSGSICPLDFGETEEKGFSILSFDGNKLVDVKFIRTPYRPRVSIDLGDNPSLAQLTGLNENDAFVRVRYRVDEENRSGLREDDIRKSLSDAYQIKVEKTIIPKERVRSAGISEIKSLEEKILRWGETVNVTIPPGVLEKAKKLEEIKP